VYWAVNLALSVGLVLGGLAAERSIAALFLADAGTSIAAAAIILHLVALVVFIQWQLALPIDMAAHGLGPAAYAFLWLLCLAVAAAVAVGHLLTAEPRRKRLAALARSELEPPGPEATPSEEVGG
jgi:hypothetical protein